LKTDAMPGKAPICQKVKVRKKRGAKNSMGGGLPKEK